MYFFQLAENEVRKSNKNLLRVKKHYVYAAKLVELHKKSSNSSEYDNILKYNLNYLENVIFLCHNLQFLGDFQSSDPLIYETAWKGAEAYHYYIMAQRQLYSGKLHDALCIAYKLQDYTDYIPEMDVYVLLTLTACLDRSFGICSKALMKLKSLKNVCYSVLICGNFNLLNNYF